MNKKSSHADFITLMAVGDVALGDHPICMGYGISSIIEKKGLDYIFQYVAPTLRTADIVFGNLECVLTKKSHHSDIRQYFLRGYPNYSDSLKKAGFSILNITNNHILDHGLEAAKETKKSLIDSGIEVLGFDELFNNQVLEPKIINIKNKKIGFLSFCLSIGTLNSPIPPPSIMEIEIAIKQAKKRVDYLCLSLHWGCEFFSLPSPRQIKIAHHFVKAGADIILGHHPHVIQPVEEYNGSIIAYSLGNFVFDFRQIRMRKSEIIEFNIGEKIKPYIHPVIIKKGVPMVISKKLPLNKISTNLLTSSLPLNYDRMARKEITKFRVSLQIQFLLNFWKYSREWYQWVIKKWL